MHAKAHLYFYGCLMEISFQVPCNIFLKNKFTEIYSIKLKVNFSKAYSSVQPSIKYKSHFFFLLPSCIILSNLWKSMECLLIQKI